MSIFEQASRQKARFKATNGLIGVEDLWDLPLVQLDTIGKELRKELRDTDDSLIAETKTDKLLALRFEIVKYIIDTKLAERDAAKAARDKTARRQELLAVLKDKQSESLRNKSVEDIQKELEALD